MNRAAAAVVLALALGPASVAASAPVHLVRGAMMYDASSPLAPDVLHEQPEPSSRVRTFFPQFSATIDTHGRAPLRRRSVHLYIDGADVTANASLTENTLAYIPRTRMGAGWHDVFLEGADTANRSFSAAWVFQSEAADLDAGASATSGFAFFPSGDPHLFPGSFMHFFLLAPFDGFALLRLCGLGALHFVHVPFSPAFFVTVSTPFAGGFTPFFGCNAGAFFTPFNQFNAVFLPVPIGIAGPSITGPGIPMQPSSRQVQPVYRRGELPVIGAPPAALALPRAMVPVYRAPPPMTRMPLPLPRVQAPIVHPAALPPAPIPHHPQYK